MESESFKLDNAPNHTSIAHTTLPPITNLFATTGWLTNTGLAVESNASTLVIAHQGVNVALCQGV